MKELLILAKSLGGGGSEVALIELINALPEDVYNVTLAVLDDDMEYYYRLKKNVRIVRLEFDNSIEHALVSMYSFPAKVLKKLSINKYLPYYDMIFDHVITRFDAEYDIALDFYGYGSFLTGFLARKIHAKKKATWLHDEKMNWIKNTVRYLPELDKVFGVSKAVVDEFCKIAPQFKDKASVFYNVIDINEIQSKSKLPEDVPFSKDSFNILTVGRLTKQKGYDIAIEAASILKKWNMNFVWYVIGGGRDEKKLKKIVRKMHLDKQFVFLGHKKNPYPYMKQCDLYVQPSRHEGYVITLVEARCLALPILASDIPSSREQIEDGVNGYISDLDARSFAEKIKYLYENPHKKEYVSNYLNQHQLSFISELEILHTL